jgi:adenosine deaminase
MNRSMLATESNIYNQMPKVDLHRHLEGTLRLGTIMEIVKVHGITLPMRPDIRSLVQFGPEELRNQEVMFSKFKILRLLYRTPEIITRITQEAVEDAAREGVLYLNLDFNPVGLGCRQGFSVSEVMDWVIEAAASAAKRHNIIVKLVATVNRHEPVDQAAEVVHRAAERLGKGIYGIDLAGNEDNFPIDPFREVMLDADREGLVVHMHCSEWAGPKQILHVLQDFNTRRIIHGVRVLEDPKVTGLAREMGVPFEVCLTNNYYTGTVDSIRAHPFVKMLDAGLNVSLNTDNPEVMQTTMANEYRLACEQMGLPFLALCKRVMAAGDAAFLPDTERLRFLKKLESKLNPHVKKYLQ